MIFLSALLASLSGLVAGERQPMGAPAQVEAASVIAPAQTEASVAVAQAAQAGPVEQIAAPAEQDRAAAYALPVQPVRTRLALEQSWLE